MTSLDPHPTSARDRGLRRMRVLRRWVVALTAAAALALTGLAWSSTSPSGTTAQVTKSSTDQTTSSSSDESSSSSTPSPSSDQSSSSSSSTPTATTQIPTVTSGGS